MPRRATVAVVQERSPHAGKMSVLAFVKLPVIVRGELCCEVFFFNLFSRIFFLCCKLTVFLLFFLFSNPADDPSHSFDAGGPGGENMMTCDDYMMALGFTNTPKCTADPISTEMQMPWKTMTNHVATTFGCCGGKKSACWEDVETLT